MRVPEEDIRNTPPVQTMTDRILRAAIRNVREFHAHQVEESWEFYAGDGVRLGVRKRRSEAWDCIFPEERPPIHLRY